MSFCSWGVLSSQHCIFFYQAPEYFLTETRVKCSWPVTGILVWTWTMSDYMMPAHWGFKVNRGSYSSSTGWFLYQNILAPKIEEFLQIDARSTYGGFDCLWKQIQTVTFQKSPKPGVHSGLCSTAALNDLCIGPGEVFEDEFAYISRNTFT